MSSFGIIRPGALRGISRWGNSLISPRVKCIEETRCDTRPVAKLDDEFAKIVFHDIKAGVFELLASLR